MDDASDLGAHIGDDPELFFQLTPHGIAWLFAIFHLAAGKFPLQRHGLVPRPLAGQNQVVFHNQCGYDPFHDLQARVAVEAIRCFSSRLPTS